MRGKIETALKALKILYEQVGEAQLNKDMVIHNGTLRVALSVIIKHLEETIKENSNETDK